MLGPSWINFYRATGETAHVECDDHVAAEAFGAVMVAATQHVDKTSGICDSEKKVNKFCTAKLSIQHHIHPSTVGAGVAGCLSTINHAHQLVVDVAAHPVKV